jgi:hypothetical protein
LPAYFFACAADEAGERALTPPQLGANRRAQIARGGFRLLGEVAANDPHSWLTVRNQKFSIKLATI